MHPLQNPLDNPRHEAFAFALAAGSPPEQAYVEAGFNPKNRKARAQPLADDPVIAARVKFLEVYRDEHGDGPAMWRADHNPEFFNKPYDRRQLIHWVWQVMKGTRVVTPIQWSATRFYARLCRWDIPGIQGKEQPNDLPLDDCHRETLARLDAVQAARASQLHQTAIATDDDLSEFESATESLPTDPDAPVECPWMWRQAILNRNAEETPEVTAAAPDQVTENPQSSGARKTAAGSSEGTAGTPDHLWPNVDSNPHAQLPDNQPINPENPHLCQKNPESTFSSAPAENTPSKQSLRPLPLCPSAAKKPNTPDPLPAPDSSPAPVPPINPQLSTINSKSRAPLPPNAASLIPRGFERQDVEWLATALGAKAPAWVRRAFPAAESAPRPQPAPPPPRTDREYAPHELEWLAHVMGKDTPAWVRTALRSLKE